ncbi:MAG: exodeoxyribonuclease VII small subunit [Planctomycetota bacterium]|jgi:exodeoxyribonuclease VII small subunit
MAKKVGFEQKMMDLEKIVSDLEVGELSLEEAVAHYQKGVKLHQDAQRMLNVMEKKIEAVTATGERIDLDAPEAEDEE